MTVYQICERGMKTHNCYKKIALILTLTFLVPSLFMMAVWALADLHWSHQRRNHIGVVLVPKTQQLVPLTRIDPAAAPVSLFFFSFY